VFKGISFDKCGLAPMLLPGQLVASDILIVLDLVLFRHVCLVMKSAY